MSIEEKDKKRELKKKIDILEQNIDTVDGEVKEIYDINNMLLKLKENLDSCAAIVYKALEPGEEKTRFANLLDENNDSFKKSSTGFEEKLDTLNERRKNLVEERENLLDEYDSIEKDDKEK